MALLMALNGVSNTNGLRLDQCFSNIFSIAPFSLSTRRFRPPSFIKQAQGSKFKEFYSSKVLNS